MSASDEQLTELLVRACLDCDVRKIKTALERGASANGLTHLGSRPVHMLIDPGNPGTDARQAKCLALLLAQGAELGHKHRSVYTVYERISTFLPHCARVVIEHAGGLPAVIEEMEPDHHAWWQAMFFRWKSAKEAKALQMATKKADAVRDIVRI